jgi:hypothetical protein
MSRVDHNMFFCFYVLQGFSSCYFFALISALSLGLVLLGHDVAMKWVLELPFWLLLKSAPLGCLVLINVGHQLHLIFDILNWDVDANICNNGSGKFE